MFTGNKIIGFGDLGIKAGKHSICIRFAVHNVASDTFNQETIKLVSNPITIEIPALPVPP